MQQAKGITKLTNVRRFGEKVTHRYHSVDALNFCSLPKEVPGPIYNKNRGFTINITKKKHY
jgi:hypothetical protein